jgi:DDE family transposase
MPAPASSLSILLPVKEAVPEPLSAAESVTLLHALSVVPDPRKARGRRHSLQSILFLAVGAVLSGARSDAAIAQWSQHANAPVTVCRASPHAATFARVLAAVEVPGLQQALTGWRAVAGHPGAVRAVEDLP